MNCFSPSSFEFSSYRRAVCDCHFLIYIRATVLSLKIGVDDGLLRITVAGDNNLQRGKIHRSTTNVSYNITDGFGIRDPGLAASFPCVQYALRRFSATRWFRVSRQSRCLSGSKIHSAQPACPALHHYQACDLPPPPPRTKRAVSTEAFRFGYDPLTSSWQPFPASK